MLRTHLGDDDDAGGHLATAGTEAPEMSYELDAFIVPTTVLEGRRTYEVPRTFYRLTDELALIPLLFDGELPEKWPQHASVGATVARISADYFGGYGGQRATVWRDGELVAEDVEANEALRLLGVERSGGDEWDTVGLGRYRRTHAWAAEAIREKRNRDGLSLNRLLRALRYISLDSDLQGRVRAGAARDLGELGDEAAVPRLSSIVRARTDQGLVIAAASALGRIGGSGLTALAEALRDGERAPGIPARILRLFRRRQPFAPFPIVHALGEAGPEAGAHAADVARLLRHSDFGTRADAAQALAKMGPAARAAVPALTDLLGDEQSFNRSYAARALGAIGPAARGAVERLRECLEDEEHTVRDSARDALDAIGGAEDPRREAGR